MKFLHNLKLPDVSHNLRNLDTIVNLQKAMAKKKGTSDERYVVDYRVLLTSATAVRG